ncbi:MAG: hypothetical protein RSE98_00585 [Anaerovoracaceae bacterium]
MIFWQWASQYVAVLGWLWQELCQVRFCPLVGLSVGFAKDVPSAEVLGWPAQELCQGSDKAGG